MQRNVRGIMAGPVCGIVCEAPLGPAECALLEAGLHAASAAVEDAVLHVAATIPLGGTYRGEARPLHWEVQRDDATGLWPAMESQAGLHVACEVSLAALANAPEDHRVLGEVALWVARTLGGWVALDGLIDLPREWTGQVPGTLHRIAYAAPAGTAAFHLADAAFLAAWLRHSDYHLPK